MIAITGANGLLGSYIVRKLISEKEEFVALKRKGSDLSLLSDIHESITWRDADILDAVSIEEALAGVTHVIHAAAMVSFNPRAKDEIYNANVLGTKNIVDACLVNGIKKLVHISSVAALGRLKGQTVIDERSNWVDNSLNSTYAETKYLAELEVFRAHEEGLNTVILNPSVILAAANWKKSSAKLFKYVWDERPFYIDSYLNYVDVRDVANAVHQLLHAHYPGERFILNAGSVALCDFFSQIADRFRKRSPGVKLSIPLVRFIAIIEQYRSWIAGAEPLITSETARLANTRFHYQNEKIKNTLNFQFENFDKTLDWCCQYYMTCQKAKK